MNDDLASKIPEWLKSLWNMENELRKAAQQGVLLRKGEAVSHLAEARRHLEEAMNSHQPADVKGSAEPTISEPRK